jgi:hypothetical protein
MEAKNGEQVCVLLGVMFHCSSYGKARGRAFLLVEDTYTYGMMNGEVMQYLTEGKLGNCSSNCAKAGAITECYVLDR